MAERYIPEHRRNYKAKQSFKPDELRRRREEQQVEIRKAKREESLAKRRNLAASSPAPGAVDSDDDTVSESVVRMQCPPPPPFFPHPHRRCNRCGGSPSPRTWRAGSVVVLSLLPHSSLAAALAALSAADRRFTHS